MAATVETYDEAGDVQPVPCPCGSGYETLLRCQKCGKPICPKCAVRHPVGLRCHEHGAAAKSVLYNVRVTDYVIAGAIGLILASAAGALVSHLLFFPILLGSATGSFVAATMSRAVRYKRGIGLQIVAGACIVLGALLGGSMADLLLDAYATASVDLVVQQALSPVMWLYAGLAVYGAMDRLH